MIKTLAVIGVGLIGGSFALALKQAGVVERVIGIDHDPDNLALALSLGVINEAASSLADGLGQAQVVFVAVPVGSIAFVVSQAAPYLAPGCIVTDGGSVKDEVLQACLPLMPEGTHFVGGHPIAGTEHSGAGAAFPGLYLGRRCILTPTSLTNTGALDLVRSLWQAAGCRVECMDAQIHDRVFAAVSHLPHMVAYALVHAVDRSAEEEENILAFSAGGFRDFTRIASSNPVMWRDIALMNRVALLDMLDRYAVEFNGLRERVASGDAAWLEEFFQTSKRLRDGLV
jgi:prephenate dehydrogenase